MFLVTLVHWIQDYFNNYFSNFWNSYEMCKWITILNYLFYKMKQFWITFGINNSSLECVEELS